ncbi:MAG: hypothetical protein ACR650_16095 [Methylocystis sp.]
MIIHDKDLQLLGRIVLLEQRPDAILYVRFFIARRDDDGDPFWGKLSAKRGVEGLQKSLLA